MLSNRRLSDKLINDGRTSATGLSQILCLELGPRRHLSHGLNRFRLKTPLKMPAPHFHLFFD